MVESNIIYCTDELEQQAPFFARLLSHKTRGDSILLSLGTGLRDCHEQEIFEHDIVAVYYSDRKKGLVYEVGETIFENAAFLIRTEDGLEFQLSDHDCDEDHFFVVIGNIKQNECLLTVPKDPV